MTLLTPIFLYESKSKLDSLFFPSRTKWDLDCSDWWRQNWSDFL